MYLKDILTDWLSQTRVLPRIYPLGEKSGVAESDELPSGIRGHAPQKMFEMNPVHFEKQF